MIKLLYGEACIRYQRAVDTPASGSTNAINPGQVVMLAMDEEIEYCSNVATPLGLSFDSKNTTENECAASGKVTVLMGEYVAQTDQLASGVSFDANDKLYSTTGGLLTKTDPGSGRIVGLALGPRDSNGMLEVYWNLQL